jgi:glycosyltransferase involved in cell wall biosynthesis
MLIGMRVTFIIPQDSLAGGMRVIATYADRLSGRGHRVAVIAGPPPVYTLKQRLKSFVRGGSLRREQKGSHFTGLQIDRRFASRPSRVSDADVPDADVVLATWWSTAPQVAALAPSKGAKAYFIQGYEATIPSVPADQVDATWRLPMQKITIAPWLQDLAREKFGDPYTIVVPNSVDTKLFHAPERGKQRRPTAGLMYAPFALKGWDVAIEALSRIRERIPDLRVVSFGSSPPTGQFPVPRWVEFTLRPPQPSLKDIYASCDVWIWASRIEGFGLPMLEAMACRTPVVGTMAGAGPQLLSSGAGKLVAIGDATAMAEAVLAVLQSDEPQWRAMSARAYEVATSYSWDDAAVKFEEALRVAIDRSKRGELDLAAMASGGLSGLVVER